MQLIEIIDKAIPKENRKQLNNIHRLECEEVLDDLGYVDLNRNDDNLALDAQVIKSLVLLFRLEYKESFKAFHSYDQFSRIKEESLTEAELDFMQEITSMEGEFDLHKFTLEQIEGNKLLCRILNYRLNILSVFEVAINNSLSENCKRAFDQLKIWTNKSTDSEIITLIGDVDELTEVISYENSKQSLNHNFAFFGAQKKRFKIPAIEKGSNWDYFVQGAFGVKKAFTDQIETWKESKPASLDVGNKLNQLQLRLIQIRLWLYGSYEGKLDNDIGPLTVTAIDDALNFALGENSKAAEDILRSTIHYMGKEMWVVNVNYLFHQVFPNIFDYKEEDDVPFTLSEKIAELVDGVEEQGEKDELMASINERIDQSINEQPKRKVKTRGGRGFFKSIRRFFRNVGEIIKNGVRGIIDFLNSLFNRIKNGLRILLREIKKIVDMIKTALRFFFSKRMINSKGILTDYDSGFDNVTLVGNQETSIEAHKDKIEYIARSMEETSGFLGVTVKILISALKGPYGWLQLGIDLIKYLANTKFSYNNLSFRTFE